MCSLHLDNTSYKKPHTNTPHIKPNNPSGLFHTYKLDESVFIYGVPGVFFCILFPSIVYRYNLYDARKHILMAFC